MRFETAPEIAISDLAYFAPGEARLTVDGRFIQWEGVARHVQSASAARTCLASFVDLADERQQAKRLSDFASGYGMLGVCPHHWKPGEPVECIDCWAAVWSKIAKALHGNDGLPTATVPPKIETRIRTAANLHAAGLTSRVAEELQVINNLLPGAHLTVEDLPRLQEPTDAWIAAAKELRAVLRVAAHIREAFAFGAAEDLSGVEVATEEDWRWMRGVSRESDSDRTAIAKVAQRWLNCSRPQHTPDLVLDWPLYERLPRLTVYRAGLPGVLSVELAATLSNMKEWYICCRRECGRLYRHEDIGNKKHPSLLKPHYCSNKCMAEAKNARRRAAYAK